jgi:hypothetical protein
MSGIAIRDRHADWVLDTPVCQCSTMYLGGQLPGGPYMKVRCLPGHKTAIVRSCLMWMIFLDISPGTRGTAGTFWCHGV